MLFQFLKKVSFFLELIYKLYFFSASHSTPTSPLVLLSSQTTCDIISNNSRATAFANFYPTWLRKLYCTGSVLWTCVSWLPPGYSTKFTFTFCENHVLLSFLCAVAWQHSVWVWQIWSHCILYSPYLVTLVLSLQTVLPTLSDKLWLWKYRRAKGSFCKKNQNRKIMCTWMNLQYYISYN